MSKIKEIIAKCVHKGKDVILMGKTYTNALEDYYNEKWYGTKKDKKKSTTTKWSNYTSYKREYSLPFMPDGWEKELNCYLKDSKRNPNRNKEFEKILKMTQKNLKNYVKIKLENMGYDTRFCEGFVYGKGELPVLLVAHLDTVHTEVPYQMIYKDDYLFSPQGIGGDDRCGVYMILQIVKELKCHVLFTEDEEIGCVGASIFSTTGYVELLKDKLNYIIEFDRRNATDCVFYDCDNPDFESFIHKASGNYFKTAWGSCSDISYIAPALKTAAVNLSCGYYQEHTLQHYINLKEMNMTIEKAKQIIQTPCEERFEYIDSYKYGWSGYYNRSYFPYAGSYSSYWDDDYDYDYYDYKPTAKSYHSYDTSEEAFDAMDLLDKEIEKYSNEVSDGNKIIYHIIFETPYEFNERTAEVVARNEDEAVGKFVRENPSVCYGDILEIK